MMMMMIVSFNQSLKQADAARGNSYKNVPSLFSRAREGSHLEGGQSGEGEWGRGGGTGSGQLESKAFVSCRGQRSCFPGWMIKPWATLTSVPWGHLDQGSVGWAMACGAPLGFSFPF